MPFIQWEIYDQSAVSKFRFLTLALLAFSSTSFAEASKAKIETLPVYLSVQYHGTNQGFENTPQSAYTCAFDKSRYVLTAAGLITVSLLNSTDPRFEIVSIRVDGDAKREYANRSVTPRSGSFYGANKTEQSIYFTVFVRDLLNSQIIECDPPITNVPK